MADDSLYASLWQKGNSNIPQCRQNKPPWQHSRRVKEPDKLVQCSCYFNRLSWKFHKLKVEHDYVIKRSEGKSQNPNSSNVTYYCRDITSTKGVSRLVKALSTHRLRRVAAWNPCQKLSWVIIWCGYFRIGQEWDRQRRRWPWGFVIFRFLTAWKLGRALSPSFFSLSSQFPRGQKSKNEPPRNACNVGYFRGRSNKTVAWV